MGADINKEIYSERFNEGYLNCWRDRINKVNSLVGDAEGKILDIGCGDGCITKIITKEKKLEPYGIEIVESNISKARKRGIKVMKCDLQREELPFEKSSFDIVYAGEILEHLAVPEELVEEVRRVLKRDGIFIVTVPNIASWYNRILLCFGFVPYWIESGTKKAYGTPYGVVSGHLKAFTIGSLREMVEEHGFRVEKIKASSVDPRPEAKGIMQTIGSRIFYALDVLFSFKASLGTDIMFKLRKVD